MGARMGPSSRQVWHLAERLENVNAQAQNASGQVAEITDTFVASIMQFALDCRIDLVRFNPNSEIWESFSSSSSCSSSEHLRSVPGKAPMSCNYFVPLV